MIISEYKIQSIKSYINEQITKTNKSLNEIKDEIIRNESPDIQPEIENIFNQIEENRNRSKAFDNINGLSSSQNTAWLDQKILDEGKCWNRYKSYLNEKDFSLKAIDDIDQYTQAIITNCSNPKETSVDSKGLVVGYVQSGKTANFIGLLSRAVDAGYKLIIVLTGTKEKLRRQTQKRITKDLCSFNRDEIVIKTGKNVDFKIPSEHPENILHSNMNMTSLFIMKKNGRILQNFINWIKYADTSTKKNPIETSSELRAQCPALIIDDEADEASINVSRTDERSTIYRRITEILDVFPRSAFVGYTATPFANVLIDHQSFDRRNLYPKNFIITLKKPDGYFGSEEFFGRRRTSKELFEDPELEDIEPLDLYRRILPHEIPLLKPRLNRDVPNFIPRPNKSLRRSLAYFILSTAAKISRLGKKGHTTMFVHTHVRILMQERTLVLIDSLLKNLKRKFSHESFLLKKYLETIWIEETKRVFRKKDEDEVIYSELYKNINYVLENISLSIANTSRLGDRIQIKPEKKEEELDNVVYVSPLDYEKEMEEENGKIFIVVGGNVLSRGLTLEGLTVSYFLRTTTMYDTLLQMGRWFGFRPGYSDLPRIWTTSGLYENFYELSLVEEIIRDDIQKYKIPDIDPISFKVRIPLIPGLQVTSRLKKKDAVENRMWRLSQNRPELRRFPKNKSWLSHNISSLRELVERNLNNISKNNNQLVIKKITNNEVLNFFDSKNTSSFKIMSEETQIKEIELLSMIKAFEEQKQLDNWNIVLMNKSKFTKELGNIPLTSQINLNCFNRAPLNKEIDYLQFKTISSAIDLIKDIEGELQSSFDNKTIFKRFEEYLSINRLTGIRLPENLQSCEPEHLKRLRKIFAPKTGLLIFYPISKNSKGKNKLNSRNPMYKDSDAEENIISFMIVFPPVEEREERLFPIGNYISGIPEIEDSDDEFGEEDSYDEDIDELGDDDEDI